MTIYERLQKECAKKGISITSLCLNATGNKGNLATWKNNNGNMRSDYLVNCAKILNVSTDFLLGLEPEQKFSNNIMNGVNSAVVQGDNNSHLFVRNNSEHTLSDDEAELLRIFELLDVKKRHHLLDVAFTLEEEMKEKN